VRRLTIRLEDDLHRRLRYMSVDTGEPLQQLAVRLLTEALEKHDRTKGRRR